MPAELKQVSAKLVSFPSGSAAACAGPGGVEKAVSAGRGCLLVFAFLAEN